MQRYAVCYLIIVTIIGAAVCLYDKIASVNGWRRVPERTLFFWVLVGGGPGVYLSMLCVRHKTLHLYFLLGIPAIMLLQLSIMLGLYHILYLRGLL